MPRNRAKNNSAGPSGQSAPVVPPAPNFNDYFEAKAAWHVARAEYNRYQAVYHETAAKRHREWLQSDIGTAAFHKHKAAKLKEEEAKEPSIEELIAQAQAAIEEKKAASEQIGVANEPYKNNYNTLTHPPHPIHVY
ncbi:hypothetical protein FGRA07_08500 [Fusarium graminearum]|nr:hypothetical protein FGRA07_08500 [Fusarium graminearum]